MTKRVRFTGWHYLLVALGLFTGLAAQTDPQKQQLAQSIIDRSDQYWAAARQIWEWAEPGYQETRSSELLAKLLEEAGFQIEKGVAGIPTAFVASYGSSGPLIGILGEFDALPGLAQQAVAERKSRQGGNGYGHACGHHLFAVASAAAAIALAERIQAGDLQGRVRFYATPAEEGGGAKVFMTRAGLFDECDAVLHWHPASYNAAGDPSTLARVAAKFRFHGISSHAAGAPEQGRSALDAIELTNHAAQLLREHTPDFTRIHHIITAGGGAPNVVPDFAEAYYYVRHPEAGLARSIYQRLLKCAQAGALATETRLEVEYLGGIYNILPNDTLAQVTLRNLREQADLEYTAEESDFAAQIQTTLATPKPLASIAEVLDKSGQTNMASTDVGDVSWTVPTTGLSAATWVPGTPAHSWQAVAAGGTSIGRKGMLLAARALAATGWDLIRSPEVLARARSELEQRRQGQGYQPMLEEGQQPPLNYRNPPKK
ncbi:MAG: amidohydrolase [Acidobacteriota bacterium]